MPELPEVEVVRRGLERALLGRTIATVLVDHPRAVRRHAAGAADFAAVLAGRTIEAACRRGKYLWLTLDDGAALLGHLGMSGQLLVVATDKPDETHLRVRFTFADAGRELRFVDQRTFGGLAVVPAGSGVPAPIEHIARDLLDPDFSDADFVASVRRRRTGIKRALLDQTLVSGIGNIYADESLWRAGLHYARPTETLTRSELDRLLQAAREVLLEALRAGGTSFDALYVSVNGESGLFDRSLAVYGRTGRPCGRCESPIRRDAFMNRSSFTCPRCQPRPRRARW
ncbi:bifunctional DNA-formamidopyrimidine glycosylase/DNA-(apurinic or apyrimidinic site) lyase [Candidatus Protofrankia californiensis]|uniref:bifunctional DNA-formamidopyrimidine glycosylase/DNA-(apurinic or apyrimidinic site) lyase n=1 Tax=Candidatus Protofrankia californiensis TaxID=1839754 RepID=UPI0010414DC1|nr:bifunctional DNA-formamidopyrimidine glycosylase/DNA-(apurinic or apyrimidinic site) lyase [Candidatus Protofrankia californiensis]